MTLELEKYIVGRLFKRTIALRKPCSWPVLMWIALTPVFIQHRVVCVYLLYGRLYLCTVCQKPFCKT